MSKRQSGPRRRPAPPHVQEKAKRARARPSERARPPNQPRRGGKRP